MVKPPKVWTAPSGVILKVITTPNMNEFDNLIKKARKNAHQAGLTKANVKSAIAKARNKK